jgi:hypothetical protein
MPVEGTFLQPFRFDPFQRIVGVQWGNYAILEINFPRDAGYDFYTANADLPPTELTPTHTPDQYDALQIIAKKGEPGSEAPIIEIRFTEPNPISETSEISEFIYEGIFAESVLVLHPHVEVVDPVERWRVVDQADWDLFVALFNINASANYAHELGLQIAAIDAFAMLHPDAEITRNVTDLSVFVDMPAGGWGTVSVGYLPVPWFSNGGSRSALYNPGGFSTFTFPGNLAYSYPIGGTPPFQPVPRGFAVGKYPARADQSRSRDSFIIDLSRLTKLAKPVEIRLAARTGHINSAIEFKWFAHGGNFTAAKKRTVTFSSPPEEVIKTTRAADAKSKLGTVLVRFDQHGFIPPVEA